MKMMRLDNVAVQGGGKSASLVMPAVCACGAGSTEPARLAQQPSGPTCSTCGGSLPKVAEAPRSERQERRHLKDFLSAFV
jgi:hypothetical protein